jgi:hypothetical protein
MESEQRKWPRLFKLRIAFSLMCGISCLLFIALWIRSYYITDRLYSPRSRIGILITSYPGQLGFAWEVRQSSLLTVLQGIEVISVPMNDAAQFAYIDEDGRPMRSFLGFKAAWYSKYQTFLAIIPDWFPVTVLGIAAATPWIHWRFRLRTLLIATTLVAVVLGILAISS